MNARVALTLASFGLAFALAPLASSATSSVGVSPIKAVILVDESGSLDLQAVANERNAAALLALSELSPGSQFAIDGFGSSNGPGESAVVTYCSFVTVTDHIARERLADCAKKIHRRSVKEGNDTDHAAALRAAVGQLANTASAQTPVIFLMTDGVLDVTHSPQYGKAPAQRNAEALRELRQEILPDARRAGIQVWALGFGSQASKPALDAFAHGGAGANSRCAGVAGAAPTGILVGSSTDVIVGLLQTLARARCAEVEPPTSGRLEPGKTLTLKVHIPVIATDGAITVTKIDPSFQVSYFDPTGRQAPANGSLAGQTFELSGTNENVEALRIQDPIPGTWKVQVTDPARHPGQTITATVVWEGALEAAVSLTPVTPKPGEAATLEVRLLTRNGLIHSASALAGVRASAAVSGSFGTLAIPLRDDGKAPDRQAHDGVFAGTLTVPQGAKGNVQVVGRIAGAGLAADERPYYFSIATPGQPIAEVDLSTPATVHPGRTLNGKVVVDNQGPAQTGSLVLSDLPKDAQLTISPSSITMPTGRRETPFSVHFASSTPKREVTARIQVLDEKRQPIGEDFIATRVTTPPGFLSRFWWIFPLIALVLVGVVAYMRWRRHMAEQAGRVRGLVAELHRRGDEVSSLNAPTSGSIFLIEVIDDDDAPRIRPGANGQATVVVRRAGIGFTLEGPNHPRVTGEFGKEIPINERLGIVVRDTRGASALSAPALVAREPTGNGVVAEAPSEQEADELL